MAYALRAYHLDKLYKIGANQVATNNYRQITNTLLNPFKRIANLARGQAYAATDMQDDFWAIKDVSFDIEEGEVVGIIGRNGAGKSTLLKILSRITRPTAGRVELYGRVGSLLEVQAGFHPDLTGRENVYMKGSILGMTQREINQRFDAIVDFSGVEKFVDTPVKFYSSGMGVRLGFAIAAHLEPEILIVDEVLAVGDYRFQQKCLGKMHDVSQDGRTVLVVSHNMASITRLCTRALLLQSGQLIMDDTAQKIADYYMDEGRGTLAERTWTSEDAPGNDEVRLRSVRFRNGNQEITSVFDIRESITIEYEYEILQAGKSWTPEIVVLNDEGERLFIAGAFSEAAVYQQNTNYTGLRRASCVIPGNLLNAGYYVIESVIESIDQHRQKPIHEPATLRFQIQETNETDSARGVNTSDEFAGMIRPRLDWSIEEIQTVRS